MSPAKQAMMPNAAKRAPGWWYPWIFVGGMGVVVLVNAVLVYFAVGTWSGLETDNYYRRGLQYNEAIADARMQRERGWKSTLTVSAGPVEGRAFDVGVAFRDKAGAALEGLTVQVLAERPTAQGHDREITLTPVGGGVYAGRLVLELPGLWRVRTIAALGTSLYQTAERLQVP